MTVAGPPAEPDEARRTPVAEAQPAVRIRGLRRTFGETVAIDDLDLEVPLGAVFGLLGPTGGQVDADPDARHRLSRLR